MVVKLSPKFTRKIRDWCFIFCSVFKKKLILELQNFFLVRVSDFMNANNDCKFRNDGKFDYLYVLLRMLREWGSCVMSIFIIYSSCWVVLRVIKLPKMRQLEHNTDKGDKKCT
jgi:hypothetical protein